MRVVIAKTVKEKPVEFIELPECDFCTRRARYDSATIVGPWASMCESHWRDFGRGMATRLIEVKSESA